jgi:hypothetical protein
MGKIVGRLTTSHVRVGFGMWLGRSAYSAGFTTILGDYAIDGPCTQFLSAAWPSVFMGLTPLFPSLFIRGWADAFPRVT